MARNASWGHSGRYVKTTENLCVFVIFEGWARHIGHQDDPLESIGASGLLLGALVGWDAEKLVFYDVLRAYDAEQRVFYDVLRAWGAEKLVFYDVLRAWDAEKLVFYEVLRALAGRPG